jgi:hypothetical protein
MVDRLKLSNAVQSDSITLKKAVESLGGYDRADVPFQIWLFENPDSAIAVPGEITLLPMIACMSFWIVGSKPMMKHSLSVLRWAMTYKFKHELLGQTCDWPWAILSPAVSVSCG